MPLAMIHLAIANQLRSELNIISTPQFYIGTLAPDAIAMRKGWTRDEKRVLHLTTCGKDLHSRTHAALDFYNNNINKDNADVITGYAVHILADYFWSHLFARHFHQIYSRQMEKNAAIKQYYEETEAIDAHIYLTNVYTEEICKNLQKADAIDVLDLLKRNEILAWKRNVLTTLRDYPSLPERPLRYFSLDMIQEYLHICILEIPYIFSDAATAIADITKRYQEHELAIKYCKMSRIAENGI